MDAATEALLRATLDLRRARIVDRWYGLLLDTTSSPPVPSDDRERLLELCELAIALLLDGARPSAEARAIGRTVATAHYQHPAALEGTLQVLGGDLLRDLDPPEMAALQPRLAELLGAIAHGYYAESRARFASDQDVWRRRRGDRDREIAQALHASEARLRAMAEGLPVIIFALDLDGVVTFAAGTGLVALGMTPEEVLGLDVDILLVGAPTLASDVRGPSSNGTVNRNTRRIACQLAEKCTPAWLTRGGWSMPHCGRPPHEAAHHPALFHDDFPCWGNENVRLDPAATLLAGVSPGTQNSLIPVSCSVATQPPIPEMRQHNLD